MSDSESQKEQQEEVVEKKVIGKLLLSYMYFLRKNNFSYSRCTWTLWKGREAIKKHSE